MSYNTRNLERENRELKEQNRRLKELCEEKDAFFREMISDGLRHGNELASKHMADR